MDSIRRRRLTLTLIFASVPVQAAMTAGAFALALHDSSAPAGQVVYSVPAQDVAPPPAAINPPSAENNCPANTVGFTQIANNFNPGDAPAGTSYAIVEAPLTGADGKATWVRYLCTTVTPP
ncbi:MAG TPA: hypothetical protein VH478_05430 [Trebonia sp.]|jgi:hypothetical protein|nr:hypothetical protein [Trebonia sp.]